MLLTLSIILNICIIIADQTTDSNTCKRFEEPSDCVNPVPRCNPHCPVKPEMGIACPEVCVKGCKCKEGYIYDLKMAQCIDKNYCAAPGDEHAVFSPCKADCQPSCADCKCSCPCKCDNRKGKCVPGYICAEGYVRDYCGRCVVPQECCN